MPLALSMLLVTWLASVPAVWAAADGGQAGPVQSAEALRNQGNLAEAVRLLRAHLSAVPEDGDAARMLAETLYWMGDAAAAQEVYEAALVRHPQDTRVRLEFARMLAETGDRARARALLEAIRDSASGADALALLGTLAYWDGDFTAASRLFESSLSRDPGQAEARRQLQQIRAATSPWVRLGGLLRDDDQPLTRLAGGFEAGWFATPLSPVSLRVEPMRFRLPGSSYDLWWARADLSHVQPRTRLETRVGAGLLRPVDGSAELTAHGRIGLRFAANSTIGVEARRAPYLWTAASADGSVLPVGLRGHVAWQVGHAQGEVAIERQRFADDNAVTNAFGWLLLPVAPGGALQAGYAFSFEDARESRFGLDGRYDPYYTPEDRRTHAVLAAVTASHQNGARLHVGASYSIRTTEQAPGFVVIGGDAVRMFAPRRSHPWQTRASLDVPLHPRLTLSVSGEAGRHAFYEWVGGGVSLLYRLTPARREAQDRR